MTSSAPQSTLLQIGHLGKEPLEITCPACKAVALSELRKEVVTFTQKTVALWDYCCRCKPSTWSGKYDYNHYCSKCGCYIGRCIEVSFYKRKLFQLNRRQVEEESSVVDHETQRGLITPAQAN